MNADADVTPQSDDPERLRSPLYVRFFSAVMARRMARDFAAVRIAAAPRPTIAAGHAGRPLVLYCNHPSWWDAALLAVIAERLFPERRTFAPIDAESLQRYPFMRRCGLFGVVPNSMAGAARLLRIGTRLLGQPDTLLCITPQGEFSDVRQRPIGLRRGLAVLLSRMPEAVALPVAIEYPFWNESRPEALLRIGEPVAAPPGAERDAEVWQAALVGHLEAAMDALAGDARSRDPARFATLLGGRLGVGGVYDAWRRLRAWSSGRRLDVGHGGGRIPAGGAQRP